MARSEARIAVTIWDDDDFVALDRAAQGMYFFLLSQRDLAHTGVLPLRERRWVPKARDLNEETVHGHLKSLEQGRFIVIDEDTGELLIRSYIRRDKVYRQPNVLQAALDQLALIESRQILETLADEVRRVAAADDIPPGSVPIIETMLETLGVTGVVPIANPDPKGSRKGSAEGSRKGSAEGSSKASKEASGIPTANHHGERGDVTAVSTSSPFPVPRSPNPRSSSELRSDNAGAKESESLDAPPASEPRQDVELVCRHLADRIEANGSKRPTITKKWRDAARLMIDTDRRTVEQIMTAIDWCQQHEFWRGVILSMPKLREKYEQLRLSAQRGQGRDARASPAATGANRHYDDPDRKPVIPGVIASQVTSDHALEVAS